MEPRNLHFYSKSLFFFFPQVILSTESYCCENVSCVCFLKNDEMKQLTIL
jgi:hypothetical protein